VLDNPSAYLPLGIRELEEQPLSEVTARESQTNNVLELLSPNLSGYGFYEVPLRTEGQNDTFLAGFKAHRSGRPVQPTPFSLMPGAKQLACVRKGPESIAETLA
jgi:hypothetical protein